MNYLFALLLLFQSAAAVATYTGPLTDRERIRLRSIESSIYVTLTEQQRADMRKAAHADIEKAHPGYKWHDATSTSDKSGLVAVQQN